MSHTKTLRFANHIDRAKALRLGLLVSTILLAVFYIWQVNAAASAGYAMSDLREEIGELSIEQEKLELQVARLQSIDSVSQRVQMLGLTEVRNIEYVTPGGGSVAINR